MRKTLLFLGLLLLPSLAYGQGGSVNGGGIVVLSATGRPIGGATVTICAFGAAGLPCSPTITVYTDPTLGTPATNPATSDGNGNVFRYAAPGRYTYTVTGTGITGTSYTATVAGSGGGDVILSGNNVLTGSNTFSQQITSTVSTGTAPLSIASTTVVPNLNASLLGGATFAAPGTIGNTTPSTGAFTGLTYGRSFLVGTAPANCQTTNTGTSSCAFETGSTDSGGTVVITITAGVPTASGTITVNYSSSFALNSSTCTAILYNSSGSWNARATLIGQTFTGSTAVFNWDNNAVNLSTGVAYRMNYLCSGK